MSEKDGARERDGEREREIGRDRDSSRTVGDRSTRWIDTAARGEGGEGKRGKRGEIIRNFFFPKFVTRYANVSGRGGGRGRIQWSGVVNPVKIDELRDNALVQSARY